MRVDLILSLHCSAEAIFGWQRSDRLYCCWQDRNGLLNESGCKRKNMWRSRRGFRVFPITHPPHFVTTIQKCLQMQEENTSFGGAQTGPETTLFVTVGMKSLPVWVFSLIYSCTTPSQSARYCDTPRARASSPPPQTQRTCRRGRYPGARPGRPRSGSRRPPRGSRGWLEGGRPAPRSRRLPKGVPRERSCPLGRGCWGQNQAPSLRAHPPLGHPAGGERSHSWSRCHKPGFPRLETRRRGTTCRPRSLVGRRGWTQISFFSLQEMDQSICQPQSEFVTFCFACKLFTWWSPSGSLFAVNEAAAWHVDPALRQDE